jgi:hypothetical protein
MPSPRWSRGSKRRRRGEEVVGKKNITEKKT